MKIAILGYGTVGAGVAGVLRENRVMLQKKAGHEIEIKYILDLRDFPGDPLEDRVVHDISPILEDPEVQVVVETMGGLHPAHEFIEQALMAGKSVVTSNKDLVAEYGTQLGALAEENHSDFFFEASVGGGIPIIRTMTTALVQEEILEIQGILNGTTNYILTRMEQEGLSFEAALREAQEKGFAERNPENDIKGLDSCRKLAILSGIAYDAALNWREISVTGIDGITKDDIAAAAALGCRIKLIAHSRKAGEKIYAAVEPMMVPEGHPLASISREYNCIMLRGNMVEDVYFQGKGAGSAATGSAVAADVSVAVTHKEQGRYFRRYGGTQYQTVFSFGDLSRCYAIRTEGPVEAEGWTPVQGPEGLFIYRTAPVTRAQLEETKAVLQARGHKILNCLAIEEETPC